MKKFLSLAISFSLLAGINANAIEIENTINNQNETEVSEEFEFTSVPQMHIKDLEKNTSMPRTFSTDYSHIDEGSLLGEMNARSITQSWTGALKNQGEFTYITATLAPAQMINATLVCPKNENLNYDLFIYEMDKNGYLTNIVSSSTTSTYFNTYEDGTTKTVDEGTSFVNNTGTTKNYAVIVSAAEGGSATDTFELTVSLSERGSYDTAEPNDSPYYACEARESMLDGGSLHVPNDQDWFMWRASSEFISAKIANTAGYNVEVYTAEGNKLILTNKNSDGSYPIANGVNYIKVSASNNGTSFRGKAYSLNITPWDVKPYRMFMNLNGDEGEKAYVNYPEGRRFRFKNRLSPEIFVKSKSGYPVRNHVVTLTWLSGGWNEHTGNASRVARGMTGDDGKVTIVLEKPELPPALGVNRCYLSGAISFVHYYDIDGVMVTSEGTNSCEEVVYHFNLSARA